MVSARGILRIAAHLTGILYPPTCVLCGARGGRGQDLCAACRDDLPYIDNACVRCGISMSGEEPGWCGDCLRRAPEPDRIAAPFRYAPPVDTLVLRLKYRHDLTCARLLGTLLGEHLRQRGVVSPDRIVPVPLHPARMRERGFNQAAELGRYVAAELGVVLDREAVVRLRDTPRQAGLHAVQRRTNLRGAFAARRRLDGEHVVILDDVVTTGSTVCELARQLRRAGAGRVEVWAVARAGHPRQ